MDYVSTRLRFPFYPFFLFFFFSCYRVDEFEFFLLLLSFDFACETRKKKGETNKKDFHENPRILLLFLLFVVICFDLCVRKREREGGG